MPVVIELDARWPRMMIAPFLSESLSEMWSQILLGYSHSEMEKRGIEIQSSHLCSGWALALAGALSSLRLI